MGYTVLFNNRTGCKIVCRKCKVRLVKDASGNITTFFCKW